jgi:hypothetical protein
MQEIFAKVRFTRCLESPELRERKQKVAFLKQIVLF